MKLKNLHTNIHKKKTYIYNLWPSNSTSQNQLYKIPNKHKNVKFKTYLSKTENILNVHQPSSEEQIKYYHHTMKWMLLKLW